jgi:hypothetical protein
MPLQTRFKTILQVTEFINLIDNEQTIEYVIVLQKPTTKKDKSWWKVYRKMWKPYGIGYIWETM